MSINTVIIEDDEISLHVLYAMINEYAWDFKVCGTASHIDPSVELIETAAPELVFIDICIADGTGFDVLRKLSSRNFELIFVTAHDNYALEAFRFAAIDYLLKPIIAGEFEEAVDRVRKRRAKEVQHNHIDILLDKVHLSRVKPQKTCIPILNGYEFVDPQDILWCKSEGPYTIFYLSNKSTIISSKNIGAYEGFLDQLNFCRIHNSVIINMQWIQRYIKGKGGHVVMADGTELEVSHRRKGEFLDKLSI